MAIESVTIKTGLALFWGGFLSGFGVGLTNRRKPSPPPVDVPEEIMQAFERYVEASTVFENEPVQPTTIFH